MPGVRLSKLTKSSSVLSRLGVTDDRKPVYELALTHRSYAFEHGESKDHNERLEFLGDAILDAVVTTLIYESYPDLTEGEMARLRASVVNTDALAELARELRLGDHILLGKGEESSGGRDKASLLANVFEALVGAVYLDRGLAALSESLVPLFEPRLEASVSGTRYDSKTALQEIALRSSGQLPAYRLASSGPDHDKRFEAEVFLGHESFGSGSGRSKKEAEQNAARRALERIAAGPVEEQEGAGDARAS
ncbi:MAG: ribonuclease III [Actinobacteria bacterium]|nr:ribonuclease III [Actinomycetota bacterium]